MRQRRWDEDVKAKAVARYLAGTRARDIAAKLDIHEREIRRWVARFRRAFGYKAANGGPHTGRA